MRRLCQWRWSQPAAATPRWHHESLRNATSKPNRLGGHHAAWNHSGHCLFQNLASDRSALRQATPPHLPRRDDSGTRVRSDLNAQRYHVYHRNYKPRTNHGSSHSTCSLHPRGDRGHHRLHKAVIVADKTPPCAARSAGSVGAIMATSGIGYRRVSAGCRSNYPFALSSRIAYLTVLPMATTNKSKRGRVIMVVSLSFDYQPTCGPRP